LHRHASRRAPPHLPGVRASVCLVSDIWWNQDNMQPTVSQEAGNGFDRIGYPRLKAVSTTPFEMAAKEVQLRIGAAIRRRRRAVEITLLDLARVCGVSFQQVQKYESGACSISAAQLWTMAQALEVPISYFYECAAGDPAALARADAA
jgi:hypothetical protein